VSVADAEEQFNTKQFSRSFKIRQQDCLVDPDCRFLPKVSIVPDLDVIVPLSTICKVKDGINPGMAALGLRARLFLDHRSGRNPKKLIEGKNITRYNVEWTGSWVDYSPSLLTADAKRGGASLRDEAIFKQKEKLVSRQTADRLIFAFDDQQLYTTNSVHNTFLDTPEPYSLRFILGILNSKYMTYLYRTLSGETRDVFPQVHISMLKKLPMRGINFENPDDRECHDELVSLVSEILQISQSLDSSGSQAIRHSLLERMRIVDEKIDRKVYDLYGLTPQQVAQVEQYWKDSFAKNKS